MHETAARAWSSVLSLFSCRQPSLAHSRSATTRVRTWHRVMKAGKRRPTESKYFLFGYMNRNWEEELDVPVGPNNGFSGPGSITADQGQPTHFLPRRNRFVFRVKVPANFTAKDELVWTLTTNGVTEKAYASLRDDYKVDDVVKASETGALGAGYEQPRSARQQGTSRQNRRREEPHRQGWPADRAERHHDRRRHSEASGRWWQRRRSQPRFAPVFAARRRPCRCCRMAPPLVLQPNVIALALRNRFLLAPPVRITVGKNVGLHLSWFVYRGEGQVSFDPFQIKPWEDTRAGANSPWAPSWQAPPVPADGRVPVKVTFSQPGTYVLRALADDGALTGGDNVTITVTK